MKSLISIIILSIILANCGFKPIYNSKNSNFQILEITDKLSISIDKEKIVYSLAIGFININFITRFI